MSYYSFFTLIFFNLFCFISLSHYLIDGFSVELIHRDSSKSPLYHLKETKFQGVLNAIRLSINHVNHLSKQFSINTIKHASTLTPDSYEYLMSYSIGTPSFKVYGFIDTCSNLVWLQCKPCAICYNQTSPIFNPSKSSSYKNIPCSSKICNFVEHASCSYDGDACEYTNKYGDGSKSQGNLGVETITLGSSLGSSVSFPKIVIGCGHINKLRYSGQTYGIVGLGSGPLSLTKQLDSLIRGKFSYCLIPFFGKSGQSNSSSSLNFGDAAVVSGENVVSTPIAKLKGIGKDFYFLTLDAFSVGNKRIKFGGSKFKEINASTQNIVIDSGTPMTILPHLFYSMLESTMAKVVKLERVKVPNIPLNLCYNTTSKKTKFPKITAHFRGADVKLNSKSTFVPIDERTVCFAFLPSQGVSIFGNFAQHNLLVGYDLKKEVISFKPTDCSKH